SIILPSSPPDVTHFPPLSLPDALPIGDRGHCPVGKSPHRGPSRFWRGSPGRVCPDRGIPHPFRAAGGERSKRVGDPPVGAHPPRSEEHTSELQSLTNLVCRLLLEKKKT